MSRYIGFERALTRHAPAQDPAGFDDATCRLAGPNSLGLNTEQCARFPQRHLDGHVASGDDELPPSAG